MRRLDLSHCGFTELPVEQFTEDITELDLSYNKIKLQDDGIYQFPPNLKNLHMTHCEIEITNLRIFPPQLNVLNLAYNNIKTVNFLPEKIIFLDLSFNKIKSIDKISGKVSFLDLRNNSDKLLEKLPSCSAIRNLLIHPPLQSNSPVQSHSRPSLFSRRTSAPLLLSSTQLPMKRHPSPMPSIADEFEEDMRSFFQKSKSAICLKYL